MKPIIARPNEHNNKKVALNFPSKSPFVFYASRFVSLFFGITSSVTYCLGSFEEVKRRRVSDKIIKRQNYEASNYDKKTTYSTTFLQSARLQAMIDFQIFGGYRDATFEKLEQEYQLATTELGGLCIFLQLARFP